MGIVATMKSKAMPTTFVDFFHFISDPTRRTGMEAMLTSEVVKNVLAMWPEFLDSCMEGMKGSK